MHLNVRSSYSLLNGVMDVKTIAKRAQDCGMRAVALTDYHVLYGALNFSIACRKYGIKPLFGMDVTLENDLFVTFLAKNISGYQSLIKMSYKLSKHPSVSLDYLKNMTHDLITIIHVEGTILESLANQGDDVSMNQTLQDLGANFDDLFIGISHQESSYFSRLNQWVVERASSNGIKCVAMTKVLYEKPEDADTYRVVRAIDKSTYFEDLTLVSAPNRHFLDLQEMHSLYDKSLLEPIDAIIDRCNVDVFELKTQLPNFPLTQDVNGSVYLESLSKFGLKKRLEGNVSQQYAERLNYELSIINEMGFTDYFLIVYDVIRFAKKEGIYVGPGRGSSAGSLVAYSLGITDVDPIEYDLLFERFLNPKRISMPDIDIDFPDDKRDVVVEYVKEKYGEDRIAHIVTFGTMKAKQAFRDVARVFQIPTRSVDAVAKLITAATLKENYDNVPRFRAMIQADDRLFKTYEFSLKVEGLMRHTSIHAAGIVLSKDKMIDVAPLIDSGNALNVIQYDMTHLESLGLIKIDFLGLRNLSIIDNIVRDIRRQNPGFNIMKIPLDDKKTFGLLSRGETVGLFQLESEGMKALLKKMKPHRFMDIVDTIALYRPGPMENIPLYLKSRENASSIKYLHPKLKEITEGTFGVLVYQEQIMQVAQIMAGFDLAKADILRKAMGKKDSSQLATLRQEFIEGVALNGHDSKLGEQLYDLIEKFANYGFNKSHSVAYGLISYQMAYLKANYPELFYTYLLTSAIGSETKTRQYLEEAGELGIAILSPNINKSSAHYFVTQEGIQLPFTLIKGISSTTASMIYQERSRNGDYQSYYDAISRLSILGLKRNQLESLVKAGAMDVFKSNRLTYLNALEEALRYTNIIKVIKDGETVLNRALVSEPRLQAIQSNLNDNLSFEFETMGLYLSEHPTLRYKREGITHLKDLQISGGVSEAIVMVNSVKQHKTKNGEPMAFLSVSDSTGTRDAVVFPRVYEKHKMILKPESLLLLKVKMQASGSLLVESCTEIMNN